MENFFAWMLESSLLVLMILGIRKIFVGRVRYAGIYALWLIVFLRFMIPVNMISAPFSVGNVFSHTVSSWKQVETLKEKEKPVVLGGQDMPWHTGIQELQKKPSSLDDGVSAQLLYSADEKKKDTVQSREAISVSEELSDGETDEGQGHFIQAFLSGKNCRRIFGTVWAVVSGVLFLWLLLSNVCLMRRMKKHRSYFGRRGKVSIYAISGIQSPCLYGFFRPVIYIPSFLTAEGAEQEELEQIITHEYVHYLHRDYIWAMLRMVLVSVYWFHPFLWLAVSCSKKDAELFCDETVIDMLGEEKRFCYGEMLVRLAGKTSWGDFRYSMLSMSRRGKEMERRIRAISGRKRYSKGLLALLFLGACLAVGITCSAGVRPDIGAAETIQGEKEKKITASERGEDGKRGKQSVELMERQEPAYFELFRKETETEQNSNYSLMKYHKWLEEFMQVSDDAQTDFSEAESETEEASAYSATPEEAFRNYIEVFTEAVNTGKTDKMHYVLAEDSEVYAQQCALVKNYYRRGISEKVKSSFVTFTEEISSVREDVHSKENIKVSFAAGKTKMVRQKYRYTCEKINGGWIITAMESIS